MGSKTNIILVWLWTALGIWHIVRGDHSLGLLCFILSSLAIATDYLEQIANKP